MLRKQADMSTATITYKKITNLQLTMINMEYYGKRPDM